MSLVTKIIADLIKTLSEHLRQIFTEATLHQTVRVPSSLIIRCHLCADMKPRNAEKVAIALTAKDEMIAQSPEVYGYLIRPERKAGASPGGPPSRQRPSRRAVICYTAGTVFCTVNCRLLCIIVCRNLCKINCRNFCKSTCRGQSLRSFACRVVICRKTRSSET